MWAEARIRGAWQAQIWKRWASSGVFSSLLLAAQWNRTCLRERAMMGTVSPVLVRMLANCQADRQLSVARMLIGRSESQCGGAVQELCSGNEDDSLK
ncbi:hypothetical protein HPP92_013237 [Vanilla planifolia]|uniref:Uncharacterized protein n=1 Tax=Vanilla planifolia TaxID=51239 RepID=A0A835UYF7_VANPL|nr:hypothetical protein HPP92_013237 [Vanilla planifolia]